MAELACSLTRSELDRFASAISDLSRGVPETSPRQITAQAIFDLTGAEKLASYCWDPIAQRYHKPLLINLAAEHGEHYMKRLQDDDPITPQMRRMSGATRIEDVLTRRNFEQLAFYNDFLKPDDMYHGVNVFLRRGKTQVCDFRIFRGRSSGAFSHRDLVLIDAVSTYLTQILEGPAASDLDVLTARETEIANLVARGCTDDDIKRVLGISFSTVRTHLTRCFEKLGCANRSELAAFVSQRRH